MMNTIMEGSLSKILEDLPYVANDRYSHQLIDQCNKHRAKYKEAVKLAHSLYVDKVVMINGTDIYNSETSTCNSHEVLGAYNGDTKLLFAAVLEKTSSQQLIRVDLQKDQRFVINRRYDVITAIYCPKEMAGTVCMSYSDHDAHIIGTYRGYRALEPDLEDILAISKTVPDWVDREFLNYILWLSNQGRIGIIHRQEQEIEIDGTTYVRVLFTQPFLPLVGFPYFEFRLKSSNDITIYLEANFADHHMRRKLSQCDVIWLDKEPNACPLFIDWVSSLQSPYPMDHYGGSLVDALATQMSVPCIDSELLVDNVGSPSVIAEDPYMSCHYSRW